jgi:E3 ubiquitin-protein ligase EDD1
VYFSDHDCKLKRTSPTAYCDCALADKCGCKALVAGNQTQRENLLNLLLKHTNLINLMNSRNEHLLLFLARTVGRQLAEQENFPRRSKIRSSGQAAASSNENNSTIPEHNLEPPKFAITALLLLLGRWSSVKSLLQVGVKEKNSTVPISEDLFHLNEQHGSSHLDKFIFTLLARCPESVSHSLSL